MRIPGVLITFLVLTSCAERTQVDVVRRAFDPETDLLSLHYDHAPDKDDGQSAAADKTILQSVYGVDWLSDHVLAVSGTYGRNAPQFDANSNIVMDVVWNDCCGWLPAHDARDIAVAAATARWSEILAEGGDVWVKEGGQSDFTSDVVKQIQRTTPDLSTKERIHVVQHSDWNENQTVGAALGYTKEHTDYIRIRDANAYLNVEGGDEAFVRAARGHPTFGAAWEAAFVYYDPNERLDFSDTGELMYILGLGELGFEDVRKRYLR